MTVLHFWYLTTKALHREAVKQKNHSRATKIREWLVYEFIGTYFLMSSRPFLTISLRRLTNWKYSLRSHTS